MTSNSFKSGAKRAKRSLSERFFKKWEVSLSSCRGLKRFLMVIAGTLLFFIVIAGLEQVIKPKIQVLPQSQQLSNSKDDCLFTSDLSGLYCLVIKSELLKLADAFSIVVAAWFFILDGKERKKQAAREDWNLIDGARGSETSGARYSAIERLYQEGESLRGLDAEGADLQGIKLSRADLRRSNFQGADLQHAVLVEADLRESNLREANLQGTNLEAAKLRGVDLRDTNLTGANLKNAKFGIARLNRARMRGANLEGADFRGARLYSNDFKDTNFEDTDLTDAEFSKAKNLTLNQIKSAKNWDLAKFSEDILPDSLELPRKESLVLESQSELLRKLDELRQSEDKIDETIQEIRLQISNFLRNIENHSLEISEIKNLIELKQFLELIQSLKDMQRESEELQDLIDNELKKSGDLQ